MKRTLLRFGSNRRIHIPTLVWPYVAVVLLVILGAIISPGFANPDHLLLILSLASFLGLAIGALNGIGVAFVGIHPLVVTLGMTSIVQGAALLYTDGAPKGSAAPLLTHISTGRLFGVFPIVLIAWAVVAAVLILFMHRSVWGRKLYALGNSPKAASYSGVRVPWVLMSLYMITSTLAALAGVLLTGYTRTSYLTIGNPYQLNSIAAVVIGGASILGGEGSYVGTIAGAIIMVLVQSLLPILSIPEAGRRVISGALILLLLLLYGRGRRLR